MTISVDDRKLMGEFAEWLKSKKILVPVHYFEDEVVLLAIKFGEEREEPRWATPTELAPNKWGWRE